jgi:hypothetical protein
MNSDCAFFIGADHKICQDYATARTDRDLSYVIVADGCSSSPDTDIGARFLVKAAETFLYQVEMNDTPKRSLELYHEQSARFASTTSKLLKLDPSCLDATILTIKATNERFIASIYGDGVVAMVRNDGKIEIYSVEFLEGYPQYVSYTLDNSRRVQFNAVTTNYKEVTHQLIPDPDNETHVEVSDRVIEFYCGRREDYYCVAVLSDGVHSFSEIIETPTSRTSKPVPMSEIVTQMLAFKTTKGDFVYRRMQQFQKLCASRNWQNHDDLSVGVVYLGY